MTASKRALQGIGKICSNRTLLSNFERTVHKLLNKNVMYVIFNHKLDVATQYYKNMAVLISKTYLYKML